MSEIQKELIDAVVRNDFATVHELLKGGADANGVLDRAEVTPLHFAAQNDAFESAKLLLMYGADPYQLDSCGDTALQVATLFQHDRLFRLLMTWPTSDAMAKSGG